MSFLLDTNVCSVYLKQPGKLAHHFIQHGGGLFLSTIALAELYTWVERHSNPVGALQALEADLLSAVQILDFDRDCSRTFGQLRANLLTRGLTVPAMDLMIASVAVAHNLTIVTHNVRDFAHIPGLHVVDWLTP